MPFTVHNLDLRIRGTILASAGAERNKEAMKLVPNLYIFAICTFFALVVSADGQGASDVVDKNTATEFEKRVREYTARREALEGRMPKLSKQATAEEIAAHKKALLQSVLADRRGAIRGNIFSPPSENMVRAIVKAHYSGRDRAELRKEMAEAENKTVAVKVNGVYPEAAELVEMPATLLQALPPLPKQVRYRFVGTNLLIVDRENHLIVDYMTNALP